MEFAIQNISNAFAHAMYEGFTLIEYEDRDWAHYSQTKEDKRIIRLRRHYDRDIEIYAMFDQTWSSTALGFGGIGGQAITNAYTIVLRSNILGEYCVYFSGRFAYNIKRPNEKFFQDVAKRYMAPVKEKDEYERAN